MTTLSRSYESRAKQLYLELLKKTLTSTLWDEPGTPLTFFTYRLPLPVRLAGYLVSKTLAKIRLEMVVQRRSDPKAREEGTTWPSYGYTMVGMKRLTNIQYCIEQILQNNIPGDLIEAGVWRGGAAIFMRGMLAAANITDRTVFAADSFEGLPVPDPKYPADRAETLHRHPFLAVSLEEVKGNFDRYGLLDDQVVFLQGWFKDTLPKAPCSSIALMRLDGDMYESTMDALDNLYPKLSIGGYCIIDDYARENCKQAVDEFREKHEIQSDLVEVDWTGVYWQKR